MSVKVKTWKQSMLELLPQQSKADPDMRLRLDDTPQPRPLVALFAVEPLVAQPHLNSDRQLEVAYLALV
jgi:hypothetical protein